MSGITTHILDTAKGKPAEGIAVNVYIGHDDHWQQIATGITNKDGRIADLLDENSFLARGTYKMKFFTKPYFDQSGHATFYPYVEIVFEVDSAAHYHIPLLISAFGYTTYRGS